MLFNNLNILALFQCEAFWSIKENFILKFSWSYVSNSKKNSSKIFSDPFLFVFLKLLASQITHPSQSPFS